MAVNDGAKPIPRPAAGDRVLTAAGMFLGTVAKADDEAFLVERDGNLIWLSLQCVFTRERGSVTLICERSGLHRYIVER